MRVGRSRSPSASSSTPPPSNASSASSELLRRTGRRRWAWSPRRMLPRLRERHILDCLRAIPCSPRPGPSCDLGSGAGLARASSLAIARPDLRFVLVEVTAQPGGLPRGRVAAGPRRTWSCTRAASRRSGAGRGVYCQGVRSAGEVAGRPPSGCSGRAGTDLLGPARASTERTTCPKGSSASFSRPRRLHGRVRWLS